MTPRTVFSNALNVCLEYANNNLPVLALCDGKDHKRSRLVGSVVHEDWFTTLEAVSTSVTTLTTVKSKCRNIMQEHLKWSSAQERDVCVTKSSY